MRKEDEEEDYLDDSKSSSGKDLGTDAGIFFLTTHVLSALSTKTLSIPQNVVAHLH